MKLKIAIAALLLTGCASTPPTPIGGDTYYAAATNAAGAFGSVSAVTGKLIVRGNSFCAARGREFQLVTTTTSPTSGNSLGGASITFRCAEHSRDAVMRPDHGITTVN